MLYYILGLGLLFHGTMFIKNGLRPYDPKYLHFLLGIGSIFTLISFIVGFFIFNWYAPLIGFIILPLILSFANHYFFRANIFFMLKNQICILVGLGFCVYSMYISFITS